MANVWLLATTLFLYLLACHTQKVTKNVLITADDEKLRDPEGYEAVAQLHLQMDDDQSGSIDRFESTDFLKEDMQLVGSDRAQRERIFHHNNDELITVDDLWEAWFASEERSWTTADLVNWLENTVRLPQYTSIFIGMEIDGRALPRMAVANSSYLSSDLGIKNPVHKQKLRLKALDVVLFGFSGNSSSRVKDIALSVLLVVLVAVLFVLKRQRTRSHLQMEQLTSKLSQLKSMQSHFEDVQQRFEEEQKKRQSGRDTSESEQVETLRSQLMEAERLLENSSSAPLALQPLLRRTCELEASYISQQRMECVAEMREAIEHIDKLRKKQSSIVSSIKLATGASAGTDHIDLRIFSLKARMEKIALAMSECHQRWTEIESLCGFPLVIPPSNSELIFPTPSAIGTLPRTGSSSSFYRNPDPVGGQTGSIASSSNSGNVSTTMVATSCSEGGRVPLGCICMEESFASTTATRHLCSGHQQDQIFENVNATNPAKLITADDELLQRSVSSGSFGFHCSGKQRQQSQSFNSSLAISTESDATSIASAAADRIVSSSSSPSFVDRISPLKQDLKMIKRGVSNALFRSTSSGTVESDNFVESKRQKSTIGLTNGNIRKSKFPSLFRKVSKS